MNALSRLLLFSLVLPTVGSVERVASRISSQPASQSPSQPTQWQSYRSILGEGRRLASQGRYREAADRFGEGYREALSGGDRRAAARFLVNLANAHLSLYQYRQAMETYLEARRLAASSGAEDLLAALPVNIAWLYRVQGALREAEAELRRAWAEARSDWSPEALLLLAELRFEQGDPNEAADLFQEALVEPTARLGQLERVYVLTRGALQGR